MLFFKSFIGLRPYKQIILLVALEFLEDSSDNDLFRVGKEFDAAV